MRDQPEGGTRSLTPQSDPFGLSLRGASDGCSRYNRRRNIPWKAKNGIRLYPLGSSGNFNKPRRDPCHRAYRGRARGGGRRGAANRRAGTGKTCLTQGILHGLGSDELARSPTFVLVSEHRGRMPLYHMDLYRVGSVEQTEELELRSTLRGTGLRSWSGRTTCPASFPMTRCAFTRTRLGV